jgi:hypothetical protein
MLTERGASVFYQMEIPGRITFRHALRCAAGSVTAYNANIAREDASLGTIGKTIDLTVFADTVDHALADGVPCVLASSDDDGHPDLALKGSVMVFDRDHLAFLERSHGASIENLQRNPHVAILYRDSSKGISSRRFFGVAEVHESGELREEIRSRSVAREVEKDPDNQGIGVLIRIDRVVDGRADVLQQR